MAKADGIELFSTASLVWDWSVPILRWRRHLVPQREVEVELELELEGQGQGRGGVRGGDEGGAGAGAVVWAEAGAG